MDLDEFSDDGFDDLTDNALQELERNAVRLTQAPPSEPRVPSQDAQQPYSEYGWDGEDDDLDTTEVTNDVGVPIGRPVIDNTLQRRQQRQQQQQQEQRQRQQTQQERQQQVPRRPIPPVPNPRWNPAVDPATRPGPGARLPPNQPFLGSQRFQPRQSQGQASQFARPLPAPHFGPSQAPSGDVVSALQQRLRALEAELNVARGEASIIRTNSTKAQQEYDARIARLTKLNQEQLATQERRVEAAVAAERTASTELQFLQRDMKEVSDRARRKDTVAAPLTTPKKAAKTWGIADGFDEMDIAVSPSKGQGRGRGSGSVAAHVGERTPSKGKRKRPMADSPMAALEMEMDHVVGIEDRPASQAPQPATVSAAPTAPFEFLPLVLDHGGLHQQPPTFETLLRFAFPSDPTGASFATAIFEKLPLMGNPERPMQLLVDFSEHLVAMWTRCVEEEYWEPIKYLVSLIAFAFDLHATSVAPLVVANLAAIGQSTIAPLAEGRRRLPDGNLSSSDEYGFLEEHVDTTQILSLLHMSALACATTPSASDGGFEYTAAGFWRLMSLDLVILLLTAKQKLSDVIGMLDLLASSSLPSSIGPITDEAEPAVIARAVIERVSAKLTEPARSAMTPSERRRVRLAALRTLIAFARYPFGATQLASHDSALPRLVTCLSGSIDDLYDQATPSSMTPRLPDVTTLSSLKLPESSACADLHRIISQAVLLIHTLVTDPATSNVADISRKLSMAHGGSQRYLLALGRLTFAEEDLVIEAGIEGEVVEAAHELLEMAVTPDEGQAVSEAFGA
ncbi:DNA repair protein Rad26 [Drechmeria coniospora]|uniref:DNA repair protein Rad26 n=1 Tax=Drechmeria coniospora TaxID=98403 RepID=A0A151GXI3_DRECN|nr:DNA repair protein Rad26 [Drechmeria coniospora]KYK61814.1 DNA repair protein Rad26 [Drechmeria coniospora]